jgi:hypothetical protein
MYFLYVDESGDQGDKPGASRRFILCALLIHHVDRQEAELATRGMRQRLLDGLPSEIRDGIIDQPFGLDSQDSQFLQLADLLAYLSKQEENPSRSFRDAHSRRILERLRRLFIIGLT